MRNTIKTINKKFSQKEKICVLTAYSHPMAGILDEYCDIILVGDSLGMVLYGYDSTLPVTLNMMVQHADAVVRGSKKSLVVIDMPFGTYQVNKEQAFKNSAKAIAKSGAQAVKIEGGVEIAETIKFLTDRGIAVMAHIGLKPQSVNQHGGYGKQGKTSEDKKKLLEDLKAIQEAGAFSVVLEMVEEKTAQSLVKKSRIPVIGIGASQDCHGHVLVTEDMLGLFEKTPSFVEKQANLRDVINKAVAGHKKSNE